MKNIIVVFALSVLVTGCDDVNKTCEERKCVECNIPVFERNNYFCGKLMVERDFWCDQHYHMGKDRRHNKNAHGWGTLCGLKVVQHTEPECQAKYVILKPGVALDCCGREIVIRQEQYIPLPLKKEEREESRERELSNILNALRKAIKDARIAGSRPEKVEHYDFAKAEEILKGKIGSRDIAGRPKKELPYLLGNSLKGLFPEEVLDRFRQRLTSSLTTLFVAIRYRECYTEPVPSLFSECDCDDKCEPNRIKETFDVKILSKKEFETYQKADIASTILLDTNTPAVTDFYTKTNITILKGKGQGQSRTIKAYEGYTRMVSLETKWKTIPDSSSQYLIMGERKGTGTVIKAGSERSIILADDESAVDDVYKGFEITVTGKGDIKKAQTIESYDGAGRKATVAEPWGIDLDDKFTYAIRLTTKGRARPVVRPEEEKPCSGIYKKVIEPCPECPDGDKEKWVVLAAIKNYKPGYRVVDSPEGIIPIDWAFIDNFSHRRLVPSRGY